MRYPHVVTMWTYRKRNVFDDITAAHMVIDELRWYARAYRITILAYRVMSDNVQAIVRAEGRRTVKNFLQRVQLSSAKRIGEMLRGRGIGVDVNTTTVWQERYDSQFVPKIWHEEFVDTVILNARELRRHIWMVNG